MMNETEARGTGRLALAIGAVTIGSVACLGAMFVVGQPFGTLNDVGNATGAVLTGWLAWRLRGRIAGPGARLAVAAALAGAAVSVGGSALVISQTTGFVLAGLVSSVGAAGIGAWLLALNRGHRARAEWPASVRRPGMVAGVLMTFGIVALPGIALRIDDLATAPGWVWIGLLSWLGTYVVLPAWAIRLGFALLRPAADEGASLRVDAAPGRSTVERAGTPTRP